MVFSTSSFLFLFLPGTIILYFFLYFLCKKALNAFLFLASLVFYCWNGLQYISILIAVITVSYLTALLINRNENHKVKKLFLILGIILLTGSLVFFKFERVIIEGFGSLSGKDFDVSGILLPIGISFYTFQSLSYVIDVYRGEKALKNPVDLGMYITFFPQLIAGPIIRYNQIRNHIRDRRTDPAEVAAGLERFFAGLCKKVILANNLGVLADIVFESKIPGKFSLLMLWLGAVAFILQLYYDFSGYSDMAIGLGRVFGFKFPENFEHPLAASSITDFWRRWHISLSSWFKDYLYIPLGGSRKGVSRQVFNLFIVWLATGIWHGADWKYILWGLGFCVLIIIEKYLIRPEQFKTKTVGIIYRLFTILCVIILFVIFRSNSISVAFNMISAMAGFNRGGIIDNLGLANLREYAFFLVTGIIFAFPVSAELRKRIPRVHDILRSIVILFGTLVSVSQILSDAYNPFLYFQF